MKSVFEDLLHHLDKTPEAKRIEKLELLRKLDKTSRVKPSIAFYSEKNKCMQYCESKLEVDALYKLEFDGLVKRYLTQPCSFKVKVAGRFRRYTPDVLVETTDGSFFFIEVKPFAETLKPSWIEKEVALDDFFNELGTSLAVLTNHEIRFKKLIPNLELLYRYIDIAMDKNANQKILADIGQSCTLAALITACAAENKDAAYAWAMLAHQLFTFSNDTLLNKQSQLTTKNHQTINQGA